MSGDDWTNRQGRPHWLYNIDFVDIFRFICHSGWFSFPANHTASLFRLVQFIDGALLTFTVFTGLISSNKSNAAILMVKQISGDCLHGAVFLHFVTWFGHLWPAACQTGCQIVLGDSFHGGIAATKVQGCPQQMSSLTASTTTFLT